MDGGAGPQGTVARPERTEGKRREKRQGRHKGRMRRQVGKREQGWCHQHAARKQSPFARYTLLKLTLEQGTVRQLLRYGGECQTPQGWDAARREQQPNAPDQEGQPDPPIPERAEKTPPVQRSPDVRPYFLHAIHYPLEQINFNIF